MKTTGFCLRESYVYPQHSITKEQCFAKWRKKCADNLCLSLTTTAPHSSTEFQQKKCLVKCCFRLHWSTQYGELLLFQLFVNRRENTRSCFFRVPSPSTDTTDFEMKISHFTWGFLKRGMCSSPCNSLSQCEIKYTTCVGVFCVCQCLHCICLFLYTGLPWKRDHDLNES